jgi:hypothetical protein
MAFTSRDLLLPQKPQRSAAGARQEPKTTRCAESTSKWGPTLFIGGATLERSMSCAREFLTSNREPNDLLSIHQNNPMTPIVLYLEARLRRVRLNDG